MADSDLMLELLRGIKSDVKQLGEDLRAAVCKVEANERAITKMQNSEAAVVTRLGGKALPWILAALGLGTGGGIVIQQQAGGPSAIVEHQPTANRHRGTAGSPARSEEVPASDSATPGRQPRVGRGLVEEKAR